MSPKTDTRKSAKSATVTGKAVKGFTHEERAAMKERAREIKAEARRGSRAVKASAPVLSPRTWYGMPAYSKDGNVVCFFQSGHKFKARYATLGFSDRANLDDGAMWPTSFALKELTPAEEARIGILVKKAVS
jgi:uncharacterized protein YdhG (YjbR/CyaY superfamily)